MTYSLKVVFDWLFTCLPHADKHKHTQNNCIIIQSTE